MPQLLEDPNVKVKSGIFKFGISPRALRDDLNIASQTIPRSKFQVVHPILACVRIQCDDGAVTLRATDMQTYVRIIEKAEIYTAGECCVNAAIFGKIVDSFASGDHMTMECVDEKTHDVTMRAGSSRYHIGALNAEEHPEWPEIELENAKFHCEFPEHWLRNAIRTVAYACGTDELRPVLLNILFRFEDGLLTLAATDTHRLAISKIRIEGLIGTASCIVPRSSILTLSRMFSSGGGPVIMEADGQTIRFLLSRGEMMARLYDGTFPNFERVIPVNPTKCIAFRRDALLEAVKRLGNMADDSRRLIISIPDRERFVMSVSSQAGGGEESLPCEMTMAEEDFTQYRMAFNYRYLIDALSAIGCEKVILRMSEPLKPCILEGEASENIHILMPMQVI